MNDDKFNDDDYETEEFDEELVDELEEETLDINYEKKGDKFNDDNIYSSFKDINVSLISIKETIGKNQLLSLMYSRYRDYEPNLLQYIHEVEKCEDDHLENILNDDNMHYQTKIEIRMKFNVYDIYEKSKQERNPQIAAALYIHALYMIYLCFIQLHYETTNVAIIDYETKKMVIQYTDIEQSVSKKFNPINLDGMLWIFDSVVNKYIPENKDIPSHITKMFYKTEDLAQGKKIDHYVHEIEKRIRNLYLEHDYNGTFFNHNRGLLPLKNGVLNWKTGELYPNSPVWGFTYSLPVTYDPNINTSQVKKFLKELVNPGDDIILTQMIAQCISANPVGFQLGYILQGTGQNGKSTFLNFVSAFLGEGNVSNIALQDLGDRFRVAEIMGRIANIHPDIPASQLNQICLSNAKTLITGDSIQLEQKNRDPVKYRNQATLIFGVNRIPTISEDSYAWWRRWVIVDFPYVFPKNPTYEKELITDENLSALLLVVISQLDHIEKHGISITDGVENTKLKWIRSSDPVQAFINDKLEKTGKDYDYIETETLFQEFQKYTEEFDIETNIGVKAFKREMTDKGIIKRQKMISKVRGYFFIGIQLKKTIDTSTISDDKNTCETSIDISQKTLVECEEA